MKPSPTGTEEGKVDIQILFKDSPEAFWIKNCRMVIEGRMVRLIVFKEVLRPNPFPPDSPQFFRQVEYHYDHDEFYPMKHIHRIKRFAR